MPRSKKPPAEQSESPFPTDRPPGSSVRPISSAPSKTGKGGRRSLAPELEGMFKSVGGVWHMVETRRGHSPVMLGDQQVDTCGAVLFNQAGPMAKALNDLAMSDPKVYKFLLSITTTGGWGALVLATWPVAQAIVTAHVIEPMAARRGMVEEELEPEPIPIPEPVG